MARRKGARWTATQVARALPKSKGNTGPPWCKLCASAHWARDGHKLSATEPEVNVTQEPASSSSSSKSQIDDNQVAPRSRSRVKLRAGILECEQTPFKPERASPARRKGSILLDNITAVGLGAELKDKSVPTTRAERQAKWRREHPAAHRAQQRAYRDRKREREREHVQGTARPRT